MHRAPAPLAARHLALVLGLAALGLAVLTVLPGHAQAATGSCDSFVVSDTPTQWSKTSAGPWSSPSVLRARNPAWTVFPNGGSGTPTPQTIWASQESINQTFYFRNDFTSCGGKYVLDITADNNFVAQVNGATVQSCLDPTGHCFNGYFHSNFTPSCTSCTLVVRADNFGGDAMAQFRLQWCSGTLATTAAPSGTAGSNGWWRSAVSVRLTPTNACGSPDTYYRLDGAGAFTRLASTPGSVSVSGEGTHVLDYYSVDGLGTESAKSLTIKIDTVAPTCSGSYSGTLGSNGWYKAAGSETLTRSDATSGVAATSFTLNGGSPTAYTGPFAVTAQGTDTIVCSVTDAAGNPGSATHGFKLDSVAPTCSGSYSGTAGSNGWYVGTGTEKLTAADATSGVASTSYKLNNGATTTYSSPFAITAQGANSVVCTVTDAAGNSASPSFTVSIDTVPPAVSITDPAEGKTYLEDNEVSTPQPPPHTTVMGNKTVTAPASDATSGVARVEFYVDGALRATASQAPYSWVWTAGQETPGDHDLLVRAYDRAGNSARDNMTVTTAPSPFDVICHDVPAVIETVRTPGGTVLGLLGNVIHLPDVVKHVVTKAAIHCDPPVRGFGGRGTPCGEVRLDQAGTEVAVTLTYSVDPSGVVHVYWCVWVDSTTLAPAQPVLDQARHLYAGTMGRADLVFTATPDPDVYIWQCQVPVYVHVVAGDTVLAKAIRATC